MYTIFSHVIYIGAVNNLKYLLEHKVDVNSRYRGMSVSCIILLYVCKFLLFYFIIYLITYAIYCIHIIFTCTTFTIHLLSHNIINIYASRYVHIHI